MSTRCKHFKTLVAVAPVLAFSACGGDKLPTDPQAPTPEVRTQIAESGQDGDPRFHFLPPISPEPEVTHTFDPAVSPVVEICALGGDGCTSTIATFTMTNGPGSETIRLEEQEEQYIVNWHTDRFELDPSIHYRVRVLARGKLMGFVDVDIIETAAEKKDVDEEDFVPLVLDATLPIKMRIQMRRLRGDPDGSAGGAIEREDFKPRPQDYSTTHPDLSGFPISFNTVLLSFQVSTKIQEANSVLDDIEARIVGGIPGVSGETSGILFLRLPLSSHEEMINTLSGLRSDGEIKLAVQDALLGPSRVFAESGVQLEQGPKECPGGKNVWEWSLKPGDCNWGLEVGRVPQLWNLNPAVEKRVAKGETDSVTIGVLDLGFVNETSHEDLDYLNNTTGIQHEHGTHVAGIIGALVDNKKGIEGINPFAANQLVVHGNEFDVEGFAFESRRSFGDILIDELKTLLESDFYIYAVNVSLGYIWSCVNSFFFECRYSIDTDHNRRAQELADEQGAAFVQLMLEIEADDDTKLPYIITSAGNDSGLEAKYNDPIANAAETIRNIIVVESVSLSEGEVVRSAFSNVGGDVSAPGGQIGSTWWPGGDPPALYAVESGTSMAAPYVTGLVGYLRVLAGPDLGRPTLLGSNPILNLLAQQGATVPVGGEAANRIDAFGAALALDRQLDGDRVLRMLLDIDDGTLDGNLRVNHDGSLNTGENNNQDGGVGDGIIDMSDFRRWRDWAITASRDAFPEDLEVRLDGGPDHAKKDVNNDGVFGNEDIYPRGDFDGDGRLIPITDLEVFAESGLFEDRHYSVSDVRRLVDSGDIHVVADACFSQLGIAKVRSTVTPTGSEAPEEPSRIHNPDTLEHIYTVPVGEYTVQVEALNDDGNVLGTESFSAEVLLGDDVVKQPECDATNQAPTVEITAPSNGSVFSEEVSITFEGSAEDPEDGRLTGSSLVWTSDLDGQIGTGESFTRSDLETGRHNITLTALDSEGGQGNASVEIQVGAVILITGASNDQRRPDISGDRIVWEDARNGCCEIFMFDLSTGTETSISDGTEPAISGDQVVYVDDEIYHYDIETGTETQISDGLVCCFGTGAQPDVSGDRIVWRDSRTGRSEIFLYDLSEGTEIQLTDAEGGRSWPAISGDRIVWQDNRHGNLDIFMYDLSTEEEIRITDEAADQRHPAIFGDRIVWSDDRTGNHAIFLYNVSTGIETQITDSPSFKDEPDISGTRIIWQVGNLNIALFDLTTSNLTRITEDSENQAWPALSGDRIVWADTRNGDFDIFLFWLEVP